MLFKMNVIVKDWQGQRLLSLLLKSAFILLSHLVYMNKLDI